MELIICAAILNNYSINDNLLELNVINLTIKTKSSHYFHDFGFLLIGLHYPIDQFIYYFINQVGLYYFIN